MVSYEGVLKFGFVPTAAIVIGLGLALCGLGITKVVKYNNDLDDSFADDPDLKDKVYVHIPAIIVATFGLVGVLLVALGCCGGFKESRVLLIIYIVLIVAVLLLVFVCTAVLFAAKSQKFKDKLIEKMDKYDPDATESDAKKATTSWDKGQKVFICCGVESYTEWANATYFKTGKGKEAGKLVPESCCDSDKLKENKEECQTNPAKYKDDLKPCTGMTNAFGKSVAIVALLFVIFMAINLGTSCFLCVRVE